MCRLFLVTAPLITSILITFILISQFVLDLADRSSLPVTNNFVMQLGLDVSFIVFLLDTRLPCDQSIRSANGERAPHAKRTIYEHGSLSILSTTIYRRHQQKQQQRVNNRIVLISFWYRSFKGLLGTIIDRRSTIYDLCDPLRSTSSRARSII